MPRRIREHAWTPPPVAGLQPEYRGWHPLPGLLRASTRCSAGGNTRRPAPERLGIRRLWGPDGYVIYFGEWTFQNWQSEFLEVFLLIVLTAIAHPQGKPESKDGEEEIKATSAGSRASSSDRSTRGLEMGDARLVPSIAASGPRRSMRPGQHRRHLGPANTPPRGSGRSASTSARRNCPTAGSSPSASCAPLAADSTSAWRMAGSSASAGGDDRVNRGRLGPKGLHGWEANASHDRLTRATDPTRRPL